MRIVDSPNKGDVGIGFVFAYESEAIGEGRAAFFLVTNKHVVEGVEQGSLIFIEKGANGDPALGQGVEIPILQFSDHWHGHPDDDIDISVMYLRPLIDHREEIDGPTVGERTVVTPIRTAHAATSERVGNLDALEEVFFIGYPAGLFDSTNLTPILRRGITATPVHIDYEGKPVFLIDAAVFPGSSGSPVLAASTTIRSDDHGNFTMIGSRMLFLGVIAEYLNLEEEGVVEWEPVPTAKIAPTHIISLALNLGVVYKSSTVVETIEDWLRKYGAGSLTAR